MVPVVSHVQYVLGLSAESYHLQHNSSHAWVASGILYLPRDVLILDQETLHVFHGVLSLSDHCPGASFMLHCSV